MAFDLRYLLAIALVGCAGDRRFPLREPLWVDTDLRPVYVACERRSTETDPEHRACAPEPYVSPLAWDAADNSVFRPLTRVFALEAPSEAVNVNALDEVPDSAWFENRIGKRRLDRAELLRGACTPAEMLDPHAATTGSWTIDRGKTDGASLGFRVRVGDRKYMFKNDAPGQPERATAASVVGAAIYHAVGFNTSCEQIVYFDRDVLRLNPGLTVTDNSGKTRPFDEAALHRALSESNRRGELHRMQASSWLPGYLLGPFRYEGTRADDPNDAIAHDDRRELRGARLLAAWLNHFDAREQNSMDTWIASRPDRPDSSPGFVRHYYIDTSDCFGSEWAWDAVSRRLGRSYLLDWGDIALDFVTFGGAVRPWERTRREPGFEMFGYYRADDFDPDAWKNEYPNPAFSRATERDHAWMARILSRFERSDLEALVSLGQFSRPEATAYLSRVLEERLQRILVRYFSKLSPLADLEVRDGDRLCATDQARRRRVWPEAAFRYRATIRHADSERDAAVDVAADGGVCVRLPRRPLPASLTAGASEHYLTVTIANRAARSPLVAHLYELSTGFRLVGLERPSVD